MSTGTSPLGVGIVGLSARGGWAARSHLPALNALEHVELRGFVGSSPESVRATADHVGVRGFTDPAELAAQDDVDVVVVTVRAKAHAAQLDAVLAAGKPVLCEWPLCRDLDEARGVLARYDAAGVRTGVGLQARHSPQVRFVRELIARGDLGEVLSTTLSASIPYWGATAGDRDAYLLEQKNGSTMTTIPVGHTLDGMQFALGEIAELSATTAIRQPDVRHRDTDEQAFIKTTPDQVAISGLLEGGGVFSFHYRGGVRSRTSAFLWEINGTEAHLTLRSQSGELQYNDAEILLTRGDREPEPLLVPTSYHRGVPDMLGPEARSVAHSYQQLIEDLTGDSRGIPDFAHGVRRRELIALIERSADTGARVKV
jgi:predicted dehydrogenase